MNLKTPPKIWINLGHSTLDARSPDWSWLRRQCRGGQLLTTLGPVRGRIKGLVIPVFSDGRCFYQTALPLFHDRNPEAGDDEAALRDLLKAARSAGIPVYLGIDALGWQKTWNDKDGVLTRRPELREASYGGGLGETPSPFHPEVQKTLRDMVQELANRFPDTTGIALDLRMSEKSIDGFSAAARSQFIRKRGLDPLDFGLDNIASLQLNEPLRAWVDWRRDAIAAVVADVAHSYKARRAGGTVLVNGYADYYANRDFNDVRTAQDWLGWAGTASVDGVLLEGRWLSPFQDIDQFQPLRTRLTGVGKRTGRPVALVPLSAGTHLIRSADYATEWSVLSRRSADLDSLALLARDDGDLEQALHFAAGTLLPKKQSPLQVGSPLQDFQLPNAAGAGGWNSKALRGRRALDLFLVPDAALVAPLAAGLSDTAAAAATERVVVAAGSPVQRGFPSGVTCLRDPNRTLLARSEGAITRLQIDRAGYIRRVERLPRNPAELRGALRAAGGAVPAPRVAVGSPAPDFMAYDATGQEVRLGDYRGRRNVLVTFFPKCFTDG